MRAELDRGGLHHGLHCLRTGIQSATTMPHTSHSQTRWNSTLLPGSRSFEIHLRTADPGGVRAVGVCLKVGASPGASQSGTGPNGQARR